mmetsp:Transcript_3897/g.8171  ORF Transcript_3897/g.8171 Transcript_3897/m.8171 type:complete len:319 (+) Transcript_3897:2238-3194(+)
MEDYLTCNVCVELFDNKERLPLILSCGHSLCKLCISSIRQAQGFIMCPIDRSPENKPIESLITNLALLQLVDVSRYTDYPRCPLHPSKKLRYYCHTPCAQAFCSKCTLNHNTHSCFDPEDAKSFEALLFYIDSEMLNLNTESDHNARLAAEYDSQLNQLAERQSMLVREVSMSFKQRHAELNDRERETLEKIKETTVEIKEAIENSMRQASDQVIATTAAIQEVLSLQVALKKVMPQERLTHVAKLHKLLANRAVTFQIPHDYLKKLVVKLKPPVKTVMYEGDDTQTTAKKNKNRMNVENELGLTIGVKRARFEETES